MATTQLADVYQPTAFARQTTIQQLALNAFLASGVAVADPTITEKLSGGANQISIPRLTGVTIKEPNYSSDDPGTNSTPGKVTTKVQTARSASRNDSWSAMDLARDLTDKDPVGAIVETIGGYWATDDEKRLIQSMLGVYADNVANDGSDMVENVANDLVAAVGDAERIGGDVIINASQTMGDRKTKLTTLAIHSVQHSRLQKQGLILSHFDPATGDLSYQTYLGYRVVVDDSLPVTIGSNRITYTAILFGAGCVGYGSGKVITPSEIERLASAGNGGGQTVIHSRVNTCYHPYGFAFGSASVAGDSPTYAELAAATNWDRVIDRKQVPFAFLRIND